MMVSRITIDPTVRFGRPCIRATRISVGDVFGWLASGMSVEEILEDFEELELADILACYGYVARREQRIKTAA